MKEYLVGEFDHHWYRPSYFWATKLTPKQGEFVMDGKRAVILTEDGNKYDWRTRGLL